MNENGRLLYEGDSLIIANRPIFAVVTGLEDDSENVKTGTMLQTFIMPQAQPPSEAVKSGLDASVCGGCIHRYKNINGKRIRTCYVNIGHLRGVWDSYRRGRYQPIDWENDAHFFHGRSVRLGTWGDPAAIPLEIWERLLEMCPNHTGYTHQWHLKQFRPVANRLSRLVMASVETEQQRMAARALGYRTFRTRARDMPLASGEIGCPASKEAGKLTTCAQCLLCDGSSSPEGPDVSIIAHGATAKWFELYTEIFK